MIRNIIKKSNKINTIKKFKIYRFNPEVDAKPYYQN